MGAIGAITCWGRGECIQFESACAVRKLCRFGWNQMFVIRQCIENSLFWCRSRKVEFHLVPIVHTECDVWKCHGLLHHDITAHCRFGGRSLEKEPPGRDCGKQMLNIDFCSFVGP